MFFHPLRTSFCPRWEQCRPPLRVHEYNKGTGRGEAWEQLSRLIFRIQGHREEELQNKWETAFHPQQRGLGE